MPSLSTSSLSRALLLSLLLLLPPPSAAAPAQQQPLTLTYHRGPLLRGPLTLNLVWYGAFTPAQRSIVVDFIRSLSSSRLPPPSAASWWSTTRHYLGGPAPAPLLGRQFLHPDYTLGKRLRARHLLALARKPSAAAAAATPGAVTVVFTSGDVVVDGFCVNRCGTHGSIQGRARSAYLWVGNPETQCPGNCAWPFHQPVYGPQTPPLLAPNGDVGVDGMIINLATVLAGAVTNPFGDGYYEGPVGAPVYEAVSACTGMFGKGAFPGFPGAVAVDRRTGGSYNVHGVNGREFLVPAMWDPTTSTCAVPV